MEALEIVKDGATAAGFAKILVDLVKVMPIPSPTVILPILAFIFAEACAFLLFLAGDGVYSRQSVSITILVGIAAAATAIGATELQSRGDKVEEKIDAALAAKPGATRADVNAKVYGTGDGK